MECGGTFLTVRPILRQGKKLTYTALSAMLRFNKAGVVPQPNLLPGNYDEVKRLLGVPDPTAFMEHSCTCGRTLFSKCTSRSQWTVHKDDKCPLCSGQRFIHSQNNKGQLVLEPVCPFYYFGLQTVLNA